MKTIFMRLLLPALALFVAGGVSAQNPDRIVGLYKAVEEGNEFKAEFRRQADGSYRAQVVWLKNPVNPDGTPKLDEKNPDKSKRSVRADRIVLIDWVKYDARKGVWSGGRVYDPTKGKSYKVDVSFNNDSTLRVTGSLMGIGRSVYWTKIDE